MRVSKKEVSDLKVARTRRRAACGGGRSVTVVQAAGEEGRTGKEGIWKREGKI